jgi:hypothetical protein
MSREAIIEHLRGMYLQRGPGLLTFAGLKKEGLYFHLYTKGIRHKELIAALGADEDYDAFKVQHFTKRLANGIGRRWTWERVLTEARETKTKMGYLPSAQWFQRNQKGSLVNAVYDYGKTWETLRDAIGCFATSNFVQSRNGLRWDSHPEASLSNFLYARGIPHKRGEQYSKRISQVSKMKRAYYDLHFVDNNGCWIDVEIWGDKPHGHNEENYARTRRIKEKYHGPLRTFLGIGYKDCFDEAKLTAILEPFIGVIEPHVFDKPTDSVLYSTHWSNADELLAFCRKLAEAQPDKGFPSEDWLRKRGRQKNREGVPYNTLSVYIKTWIGGIRKLRAILGQSERSTLEWNRESAISRYREFFETHGITAGQACTTSRRKGLKSDDVCYAQNICHAVERCAGGTKALNDRLGIHIDKKWKWSKERILEGFKGIYHRYHLVPPQITSASPEYRSRLNITDADFAESKSLAGIAPEHFGKVSEVYRLLGITPIDIRTVVKTNRIERTKSQTSS